MSKDSHLQHHFVDSEQQYESSKLGMWAFLVTEVLTFAGLFCAYAIFRAWNPDMFINASEALDLKWGAINTIVLITSSLTMALAIRFIQLNNNKAAIINLILTLLFAGTFLGIKYVEYEHKFHCHQLPGEYYQISGDCPRDLTESECVSKHDDYGCNYIQEEGNIGYCQYEDCVEVEGNNPHVFFSIYFMMTGLHGIHVVAGMLLIGWLILRTSRGHFTSKYYTPVEMVGLFWHLVDLVWIFLFPLLYLIG